MVIWEKWFDQVVKIDNISDTVTIETSKIELSKWVRLFSSTSTLKEKKLERFKK